MGIGIAGGFQAARSRHLFPSLTKEGVPAILETTGNPYAHLVLRGGSETGPNFDAASVESAVQLLRTAELPEILMVDCSHGNSDKDAARQIDVADAIMENLNDSPTRALMIESNLVAGRQNSPVTYGQSITDPCLGFAETEALLYRLAEAVKGPRRSTSTSSTSSRSARSCRWTRASCSLGRTSSSCSA